MLNMIVGFIKKIALLIFLCAVLVGILLIYNGYQVYEKGDTGNTGAAGIERNSG